MYSRMLRQMLRENWVRALLIVVSLVFVGVIDRWLDHKFTGRQQAESLTPADIGAAARSPGGAYYLTQEQVDELSRRSSSPSATSSELQVMVSHDAKILNVYALLVLVAWILLAALLMLPPHSVWLSGLTIVSIIVAFLTNAISGTVCAILVSAVIPAAFYYLMTTRRKV